MDLSSLDIFRAVASERSVTGAAKRLGRVPSNVTTRIQQLEADLGVALFSRVGKRMTLTPEGEIFLSYSNRLSDLVREARQAVKPAVPSGRFRVGTMESTAASQLPRVLTRFRASWPEVSLELAIGATRGLTERVLARELDCALIGQPPGKTRGRGLRSVFDSKGLEYHRIFAEDLLIVLPFNHPGIRSAADLRVETLAALEPGCAYRNIAERWIEKDGRARTVQHSSYHAILASVTAGNAAGVVPRSLLDLMQWPAKLSTHPLETVDTLLIRRKDSRSPVFTAFLETLTARN
jgi:DNA-binding transcriptional LysR family regulator